MYSLNLNEKDKFFIIFITNASIKITFRMRKHNINQFCLHNEACIQVI